MATGFKRVRGYAQVRADNVITGPVAQEALRLLQLDNQGLDEIDATCCAPSLINLKGPRGVDTLAASMVKSRKTWRMWRALPDEAWLYQRAARGAWPPGKPTTTWA